MENTCDQSQRPTDDAPFPATPQGNMESLKAALSHLQSELTLLVDSPPCPDHPDAIKATRYDALLLASHCCWIALSATQIGLDIFRHHDNPSPALDQCRRLFTGLSVSLPHMLDTLYNVPDGTQEAWCNMPDSWCLPEGMLSMIHRCVISNSLDLSLVYLSSYSHLATLREEGDHNDARTLSASPQTVNIKQEELGDTRILESEVAQGAYTHPAVVLRGVDRRGTDGAYDDTFEGGSVTLLDPPTDIPHSQTKKRTKRTLPW